MSGADAPARILIVRTSALGDVVHALPVLAALRRHRPAARLAWVVDEAFAPLLDGHALLDEVVAVPLRRWRRTRGDRARELGRFLRRLRAFRAELAIDLMGSHKGALLALASGAPRRLGARRRDRREPSSALWLSERRPVPPGHAVERGLALLAALGLPAEPADFAPEALACGRDDAAPRGHVFLHPGAAWGNKRYPAEAWGDVAARVAGASGLPVRVGVAPGEEALAAAVVAASRGAAELHAAPTLGALAAALRGARLVLAGDTGAVHLAHALGVPVLAVHGPTDPALHGPWAAPERTLSRRLPCSFCHVRMAEAKACLLGIEPAQVAARALAAL
jgi:heptosyltransferase-1